MILYLDTSALIKRYIHEQGSEQVVAWMRSAEFIGSSLVTRVEMAATISRAIRGKRVPQAEALDSLNEFRSDWLNFQHIYVDDALVARADSLACDHSLRGYDAIHLACALTWQDLLGAQISLASFDRELLDAARKIGMETLFE